VKRPGNRALKLSASFIMPALNVGALPDNCRASIARKSCSFFKMNLPDGVFPARLISASWRRYFSAPVSKQPAETRQDKLLSQTMAGKQI
jgi:hypothetical protein